MAEDIPLAMSTIASLELHTSVVDYNIASLATLLTSDAIQLRPDYQRRFRWTPNQQSRLIESFLLNMPVPPIYLSESGDAKYSVIDGQQRLTTIRRFLAGELRLNGLELLSQLNGCVHSQLPPSMQRRFGQRSSLRAIIVLERSDPDIALRVFERLNMGTKQLNSQEIRNSLYRGSLNESLHELSDDPLYQELLWRDRDRETEAIYKSMTDVEFVLRFFTFCDEWPTFTGLMSAQMDRFMRQNQDAGSEFIRNRAGRFRKSLEVAKAAFGHHAFRPWRPDKGRFDPGPRSAIVDGQLLACQYFEAEQVRPHRQKILEALKREFETNKEFVRSLTKGSNHNLAVQLRVEVFREVIRHSVVE